MYKNLIFCLALGILLGCKKPYEPPEITAAPNFLVVEGVINTNPSSETIITLTRSRRLVDTVVTQFESNAQVYIKDEGGISYFLSQNSPGVYRSGPLTLNSSRLYRLKIFTSGGEEYLSDLVPVKQNVIIDSLTWEKQNSEVTVFLNTHDDQKNTRFYRWDYIETWEYHPFFDTHLGFKNGQIYFRDSTEMINKCWSNHTSTNIILASTLKLSEDIISHFPIVTVPPKSEKLTVKYSVLVKQYALTQEAYEYWQILKKNTEQLGTLFDAQPSQLRGNIYNVKNPAESVIGFVTTCGIQEKRIFIRYSEVAPWLGPDFDPGGSCPVILIDPSEAAQYLTNTTTLAPGFFVTGGGLAITKIPCVDCTVGRGIPKKPPFWQ